MRVLALALVLANLVLLTRWWGLWGPATPSGSEPQRAAAQLEPQRLRLLAPAELEAARSAARQATAAAAGPDFDGGPQCVEIGDLAEPAASELRARLAALAPGERLLARTVAAGGWWLVALPPARTRAEAERQLAAVRRQSAPAAWLPADNAVALGAFRTVEAARLYAATLERQGVKGARVAATPAEVPAQRWRIEAADAALAAQLEEILREFPPLRLARCAG